MNYRIKFIKKSLRKYKSNKIKKIMEIIWVVLKINKMTMTGNDDLCLYKYGKSKIASSIYLFV